MKNLKEIPLILVFSYFVALLLKKPFPGKTIVKCIFFLTVILSSDMFMTMQIEMESFNTALVKGVKENSESFFTTINGAYFPSTSIIIVNFVYTVIDSFNSMLSPALQYINNEGFKGGAYGYGSAMSIIYFICMGVAIAVVLLLTRKKVFYYV